MRSRAPRMAGINNLVKATVGPTDSSPWISGSKFVDLDSDGEFPKPALTLEVSTKTRAVESDAIRGPKKKLNNIWRQKAKTASVACINELLDVADAAPKHDVRIVTKFEDSESESDEDRHQPGLKRKS